MVAALSPNTLILAIGETLIPSLLSTEADNVVSGLNNVINSSDNVVNTA